mgnify:CR=1 FL=1|tara:strand:+ start:35 stop:559 length:525 start_codon:yes stop_codon:yes gene_type:complete
MVSVSDVLMTEINSREYYEGMTYDDIVRLLARVIDEGIIPYIKLNVGDDFDMVFYGIDRIRDELNSSGAGVRMRPRLIKTMLYQEASAAEVGMTLTRKVPGGSPSAAAKREFRIKKGISKMQTADTFDDMYFVAEVMNMNRLEQYELYDYLDDAVYPEDPDDFDGSYYYREVPF